MRQYVCAPGHTVLKILLGVQLDEDLVKAQQAAYSVAGVDEEVRQLVTWTRLDSFQPIAHLDPNQTPAAPVLKRTKKRKEPEDGPVNIAAGNKRGKKAAASSSSNNGASTSSKSKNTAVYITGLPWDTDADELAARFGKFGIIEEDDAGYPKVKLYAREDGTFSGDALVVYFKEESVDLAVTMLDDAELRIGEPASRMHVQRAEFSHKHEGGEQGQGGSGVAKPRRTMEDKKRATRRIGKMQKCVFLCPAGFQVHLLRMTLLQEARRVGRRGRVRPLNHRRGQGERHEQARTSGGTQAYVHAQGTGGRQVAFAGPQR